MPRDKHPPKKKHPTRPRPVPLPPLTDGQRLVGARQEFAKALVHLNEAKRMAVWGEAPNACVHSAYYAMHHAACAAILVSGGVGKLKDVPKSHEHVIEHYGKLVASENDALAPTGMVLSRARTDRVVADYGMNESLTAKNASETTEAAEVMVKAISERWATVASVGALKL